MHFAPQGLSDGRICELQNNIIRIIWMNPSVMDKTCLFFQQNIFYLWHVSYPPNKALIAITSTDLYNNLAEKRSYGEILSFHLRTAPFQTPVSYPSSDQNPGRHWGPSLHGACLSSAGADWVMAVLPSNAMEKVKDLCNPIFWWTMFVNAHRVSSMLWLTS